MSNLGIFYFMREVVSGGSTDEMIFLGGDETDICLECSLRIQIINDCCGYLCICLFSGLKLV